MPVPPTLAAPEAPGHLGREPWGPGLVTHGLAFSSRCDQPRTLQALVPLSSGARETLG